MSGTMWGANGDAVVRNIFKGVSNFGEGTNKLIDTLVQKPIDRVMDTLNAGLGDFWITRAGTQAVKSYTGSQTEAMKLVPGLLDGSTKNKLGEGMMAAGWIAQNPGEAYEMAIKGIADCLEEDSARCIGGAIGNIGAMATSGGASGMLNLGATGSKVLKGATAIGAIADAVGEIQVTKEKDIEGPPDAQ